ncbi:MAG: OmpH family outer membrane protein [Rhodospirillales bacterium]|nr:OmpH family outer membrane protein [Rhodospirillales bacterium]
MSDMAVRARVFFVSFVMAMALLVPVQAAHADTKVAIVNVQTILMNSLAAKDIQRQIEAYQKSSQAEFSKKEAELQAVGKALDDKRKDISTEQFDTEKLAFDKKVMEARRAVQERKQAFAEATAKASGVLQKEILKIVEGLSKEKDFDLVLTGQGIVWSEPSLDITADVMKKLDASLSAVKLDVKGVK